jgi:hypothetical protein
VPKYDSFWDQWKVDIGWLMMGISKARVMTRSSVVHRTFRIWKFDVQSWWANSMSWNIPCLLKYLKLETSGGEGKWLYDQPLPLLIRFTRYARSRREWLSAEIAHKTLSSQASKVSCSDVYIILDVQRILTPYLEKHFHLGTTTYMTDRRLRHPNIPFTKSKRIPGGQTSSRPSRQAIE